MKATILPPAPRPSVVAVLAIVGLSALSACQKPEPPAQTAPMHAVARGRIEVQGGLVAVTAPLEGELRALEVVEGQTCIRATCWPASTTGRLQTRPA